MESKLVSFIIKAEKGFFKKPDINDGIYLTYNMIHKPVILGILGAIIGLRGYEKQEELPEYYTQLKGLKIGIKPIGDDKGVFRKEVITYSNTTGFASYEKGGVLVISEQTIIKPSYKIYLLLDTDKDYERQLYENIKNQTAEYLPYMGKNDYSLWWERNEVEEYDWEEFKKDVDFSIDTIFRKEEPVMKSVVEAIGRRALREQREWFCSFEKLPLEFDEELYQYKLADFAYTNAKLKSTIKINSENLFKLKGRNKILFLY